MKTRAYTPCCSVTRLAAVLAVLVGVAPAALAQDSGQEPSVPSSRILSSAGPGESFVDWYYTAPRIAPNGDIAVATVIQDPPGGKMDPPVFTDKILIVGPNQGGILDSFEEGQPAPDATGGTLMIGMQQALFGGSGWLEETNGADDQRVLSMPVINGSPDDAQSRYAFIGAVVSESQYESKDEFEGKVGVWSTSLADPSDVLLRAFEGEVAPTGQNLAGTWTWKEFRLDQWDLNDRGTVTSPVNQIFEMSAGNTSNVVINRDGRIAIRALIENQSQPDEIGIWVDSGAGALTPAILGGFDGMSAPVISHDTLAAYVRNAVNDTSLWSVDIDSLVPTVVVRSGDPVPGMSGWVFDEIGRRVDWRSDDSGDSGFGDYVAGITRNAPDINENGTVAFNAVIREDGPQDPAEAEVVGVYRNQQVEIIAVVDGQGQRQLADLEIECEVEGKLQTFPIVPTHLGRPVLNNYDRVAFVITSALNPDPLESAQVSEAVVAATVNAGGAYELEIAQQGWWLCARSDGANLNAVTRCNEYRTVTVGGIGNASWLLGEPLQFLQQYPLHTPVVAQGGDHLVFGATLDSDNDDNNGNEVYSVLSLFMGETQTLPPNPAAVVALTSLALMEQEDFDFLLDGELIPAKAAYVPATANTSGMAIVNESGELAFVVNPSELLSGLPTRVYRADVSCQADLNGDGKVGSGDLALLISAWGACPAPCPADFNGDGMVGAFDQGVLLSAWGNCTEINSNCE